jgi:hypothetical protein
MDKKVMIKKLINVPVETPKGKKVVKFFQFSGEDTEGARPCEQFCPYADICDKIPDPRDPQNKDRSFLDFCGELSEAEDDKFVDVIPCENSIETSLSDVVGDVYQTLINRKHLVSVDKAIDKICPGWCDSYDKEHSACKVTNKSCMLSNLFAGAKSDGVSEGDKSEEVHEEK